MIGVEVVGEEEYLAVVGEEEYLDGQLPCQE